MLWLKLGFEVNAGVYEGASEAVMLVFLSAIIDVLTFCPAECISMQKLYSLLAVYTLPAILLNGKVAGNL
jgi:hypothetical protein